MDFLRQLLFPVTVCTIVASVWALAWSKQLDSQAERAAHPPTLLEFEHLQRITPASIEPLPVEANAGY